MNLVVGLTVLLTALSTVKTATVPQVELVLGDKTLRKAYEFGNGTSYYNLKRSMDGEFTTLQKCVVNTHNGVSYSGYPEDPELADQCYKLKAPVHPNLMECVCKRVEFAIFFVRRLCFYIMHK